MNTSITTASAGEIALPGCPSKCGDMDVPYPFGTTPNCSRHPGFEVICEPATARRTARLRLEPGGRLALAISVANATLHISSPVWSFDVGGNTTRTGLAFFPPGGGRRRPYIVSARRNVLVHVVESRKFCYLGKNVKNVIANPATTGSLMHTASVVAVEKSWWRDKNNVFIVKLSLAAGQAAVQIPVVLDWVFDNTLCTEARGRPGYGCVRKNSECVDSRSSAHGYVCRCSDGYQGNPYVMRNGCQRIHQARFPAGIFATGVGIGMSILLSVFGAIFLSKKLKFVDKDIAKSMVFSLKELEKATNMFDEALILGGGGHGTVYKGILLNQHVVAIKKSKIVVKREIDGFINEVVILSQINHRNVVKLFGCCLETEVPLLVYEFIPNGTLYDHLHVDNARSLSWTNRLRIASEVACSLAYLHSAASISIIHRDIKTSNILLDDRFKAKVSDFGASRGIAIDKSGVTTAIQGTFGYLDPEYYYTRRLTDKSDVYSYGVILVELLTRKKPTAYSSGDGLGLVAHFILLLSEDRLSEILDEQITEEGKDETKQVAAIAAMCLRLKGEDRPSMRHVETSLRGIHGSNNNLGDEQLTRPSNHSTFQRSNAVVQANNSRRRFSMENEFLQSASFPR
uniref:Protein kinase domain-containing protein n=1 Tax=Leersia perrieri TaxID=77586 RepID=A0A0D9X9G3_9ORYZ